MEFIDYPDNYAGEIDSALERAKEYLLQNDWIIVSNDDDILTEKQQFPDVCSIDCYRVSAIIDKSVEDLVSKIWNITESEYKNYDKSVTQFTVHKSTNEWKLFTLRNDYIWPVKPRETLALQVIKREENNVWLISISIDDINIPCSDGVIRTKAHVYVTGLEKISDNQTKYSKVALVDPQGSIPSIIINMIIGNFSHIVKKLRS